MKRSPVESESEPSPKRREQDHSGGAKIRSSLTITAQPTSGHREQAPFTGKRARLYGELLKSAEEISAERYTKSGAAQARLKTAASIGLLSVMDEQILNSCQEDTAEEFIDGLGPQAARILDICVQREVREWYRKWCILTGHSLHTQAAHIFSNSIERFGPITRSVINTLKYFWPREDVEELRALLANPAHEKTNLIVLMVDVHSLATTWVWCRRNQRIQYIRRMVHAGMSAFANVIATDVAKFRRVLHQAIPDYKSNCC
ncbi:hypothetical protein F5Y17DRAFT_458747 [Xylariaceae sp. FL0594]|nr:hypothetical protein F5Y17DRAFT_458747 [Xylariaceae sp. FL0594]